MDIHLVPGKILRELMLIVGEVGANKKQQREKQNNEDRMVRSRDLSATTGSAQPNDADL